MTDLWLKRASGPAGSDDGTFAIPPSGDGPHPWLGAALSQLGRMNYDMWSARTRKLLDGS
jgi:hypothetical protein